jgi:hypothetical protein
LLVKKFKGIVGIMKSPHQIKVFPLYIVKIMQTQDVNNFANIWIIILICTIIFTYCLDVYNFG